MRVVSWNLNGIRAAHRKGLVEYIERIAADVMLFQEVRALPEQMPKDWSQPEGYEVIWHPAQKKGLRCDVLLPGWYGRGGQGDRPRPR